MQSENENENEKNLTPAEEELARALARLRPVPAKLDRDRLMFQAGRASTRRAGRFWQGVAAVLAAGLCLSVALQRPPRETVRVVRVTAPSSHPPAGPTVRDSSAPWPLGPDSYLRLRSAVLERGLCALPESAAPSHDDHAMWPTRLSDVHRQGAPGPSGLLEWLDI